MALLNPAYLTAVIPLRAKHQNGGVQQIASAFFWEERKRDGQGYDGFLITNRHVIKAYNDNPELIELQIWLYPKDKPAPLALKVPRDAAMKSCYVHENDDIDVAVLPITFELTEFRHYVLRSDRDGMDLAKMQKAGVSEGSFVYMLGFPLGAMSRQHVTVRAGAIAQIQPTYDDTVKSYAVDVLSTATHDIAVAIRNLPGNSGGPVVLKPETESYDGSKVRIQGKVIGITTGYINAYLEESGAKFHSGLMGVEPLDRIQEVTSAYQRGRSITFGERADAVSTRQQVPKGELSEKEAPE